MTGLGTLILKLSLTKILSKVCEPDLVMFLNHRPIYLGGVWLGVDLKMDTKNVSCVQKEVGLRAPNLSTHQTSIINI